MALTPAQRSLRARGAALAMHSHSGDGNLTAARAGFREKFYDQVDPDRTLPEAEREKRASAALRSHMMMLALRSSKKRAKS